MPLMLAGCADTEWNLSFLNWLTILPALFCFDDAFVQSLSSSKAMQAVKELQQRDRRGEKYPIGEQNGC